MISHTVQWCIGRWAQQLRVWERDKFEETSLHWWWDGLCNETVVGWSARGMWLINCYDDTPLPVYLSLYGSCCWPSTVSSISWIIRGSVRYSSVVVQFIRIITTCVNCLLVLNTFLSLFWWVGNLRQSSTTPAQRINCAGIHSFVVVPSLACWHVSLLIFAWDVKVTATNSAPDRRRRRRKGKGTQIDWTNFALSMKG